ncbi:hypothetical protein, partial [Streptomyces sp. MK5]|uniref:hypothetical protein n=1 Tax=Streptomyces sp. MK5 TaxID=3064253 RepID=UPI002741749C
MRTSCLPRTSPGPTSHSDTPWHPWPEPPGRAAHRKQITMDTMLAGRFHLDSKKFAVEEVP